MAIFRGIGGAGDSTTDATVTAVTEQATNAVNSAISAASSASSASSSASAASTSETNASSSASSASISAANAATSASNASSSASSASTSATNAAASETAAGASETAAAASESAAATSASNAASSASSASSSASTATTKASEASASASAASTSASNAATSASNAAGSESAASTSEGNAATSETNAANSASAASGSASSASSSASAAAGSASAASTSASNAAASETAAAASETAAGVSETNAATSESNAATSASNAATSESNAATSASNAATSAATATTKAGEASTSATNAAASASAASSSASAASASAAAAAASEIAAGASETAAAASETAAGVSETNAATSETNAGNSASAASASQSAAATSATNASNSASAASTSATNAAASASAASASEAAAAASFDAFDDRYLGDKSSNPSVDNDGNSLLTGALYFDTSANLMKVYNGSSWVAAYASLSGAMFGSNNLSDVASVSSSRSNLGLGTGNNVVFNQVETTNGLIVGGDLTVNGTLTTIDTTNLAVSDNMIYLNDGSTVTNPDLGWAGNYNDGTYAHAGVFRDATDGKFKFYDGYTPEPGTEINTGHASFSLADVSAGTFYGALSGNASTATALQTARTIGLSGDVSGSVSFNGTSNVTITAAVADDSHNHIVSNVDGLQTALDAKAPLASPALTGTPTVPTAAVNTNTTQAASTAFVVAQIADDAPTKTGTGASGTWGISITGNAATATSATSATTAGSTTGNAATATKLATARTIGLSGDVSGSASFDGSANATITAVVADDSHNHIISNVDGLQTALDEKLSTSGKAADSELLDGVNSTSFLRSDANDTKTGYLEMQDGSANYIALGNAGDFRMWHDGTNTIFRNYNEPNGDMIWQTEGTGGVAHTAMLIKGNTTAPWVELYYDSVKKLETTSAGVTITGTATATTFSGDLSGNATTATSATSATSATTAGSCTGNAATATTLQTARTINGVSFDGSANITVEPYISNDDTGDTNCPIVFTANSTAGHKRLYEDSALYFDNTNNKLYSTTFSGALDGNASTATYATTAGNGGVTSVNGSTGAVTISVPASFPSGTAMLFAQTSAPTGWTKSTTHNNKALRLVSGTAGSGGSAAFTTAFGTPSVSGSVSLSGTVGSTTLTTAQLASHTHNVAYSTAGQGGSGDFAISGGERNPFVAFRNQASASAGSNSSHTHSFSGSGSLSSATASINVQYVDVIIATKD